MRNGALRWSRKPDRGLDLFLHRASLAAGVDAVAELRCAGCGYGIVVTGEPPACPMCRSSAWGRRPPGRAIRTEG